jgi:hypothetical protein
VVEAALLIETEAGPNMLDELWLVVAPQNWFKETRMP